MRVMVEAQKYESFETGVQRDHYFKFSLFYSIIYSRAGPMEPILAYNIHIDKGMYV